jgi:serine/threonine-protein kinase PknG
VTTRVERATTTARTSTSSTRAARRGFLAEMPAVERRDPSTAVMRDPFVPENKRFCANPECQGPVGRARFGRPGLTEGVCPHCRWPFSYAPKLAPGDRLADQYEVVGCLAHGGLGWVYLAKDCKVSVGDSVQFVALKGVLNSNDEAAAAAALSERRFLVDVDHPNIVKIHSFVEHDGAGYIVMAYVDGTSLKRRLEELEPLRFTVKDSISYILEILPALGYLHGRGLVYCDFKPDNVIHTEHSLVLIDLGAVYRMGDTTSSIYGTPGFQAPELLDSTRPSVSSDLFTVGRCLAVMCTNFRGYQKEPYLFAVPDPDTVPELRRFDSLYRFLLKATAEDPEDRFQSTGEMFDQLLGIRSEVVAAESGAPEPEPSTLFTGDGRPRLEGPEWRELPGLRRANGADANDDRGPDPVDVDLRLVETLVGAQAWGDADVVLSRIEEADPWEWRTSWWRGVAALASNQPMEAEPYFGDVYAQVPGELAPKLARAVSLEYAEMLDLAAYWYDVVSRTDPAFTNATLGLARCRRALGDLSGAADAYERVAPSSAAFADAQVARARLLLQPREGRPLDLDELVDVSETLESLRLDRELRDDLRREVLVAALALLTEHGFEEDPTVSLAGASFTEFELRRHLERTYRSLAALAETSDRRFRLVDEANDVRPRTWT